MYEDEKLVGEFPYFPKQERAQQKRHSLLESGRALFLEKGYEHTTAKDIASHAGVAIGTFYRYFSDKRQLLMSLLEDQLDNLMPPEPTLINGDPETFFATIMENHFIRLEDLGLQRVFSEILLKDSQFAEVVAEAKKKIHNRIYAGLKIAKEKGLVWQDLNLETVSWAIMALTEKIPEIKMETGIQADYFDISKVICRMVFPPDILEQLKNK